jgi:hypothetical protein
MESRFKHTPEQARKLLDTALRSGEYKQCKGALRIKDTFCCLGVAEELFRIHEGQGEWITPEREEVCYEFAINGVGRTGTLNPDVQDWLGFSNQTGAWGLENSSHGPETNSLARLNDHGKTFIGIADTIKSNPPGLLKSSV